MTPYGSCSRAGSNHLCGRHGSPDRKGGEVHFDHPYRDDGVDDSILDAFIDCHAVVDAANNGHVEVTMSVPAENMRQACLRVLDLVSLHDVLPAPCRIDVMPAIEYDRLSETQPVLNH